MSLWEKAASPLTGASAVTFAVLSTLRRKRVFHPDGQAYDGALRLDEAALPLRDDLAIGEPMPAIVRFSRGGGLPQAFPDVLGLAIKLPDVYGMGRDQDFLLASSGDGLVAQNLLLPRKRFFHTTYSSVLPYRVDSRQIVVGAKASPSLAALPDATFEDIAAAVARGPITFDVLIADLGARWRAIGVLVVDRRLDQPKAEELAFNPWNTAGGLEPAGPLNVLRKSAYAGSQAARGTDPA